MTFKAFLPINANFFRVNFLSNGAFEHATFIRGRHLSEGGVYKRAAFKRGNMASMPSVLQMVQLLTEISFAISLCNDSSIMNSQPG